MEKEKKKLSTEENKREARMIIDNLKNLDRGQWVELYIESVTNYHKATGAINLVFGFKFSARGTAEEGVKIIARIV
jgi:hypothetical protein